MGFHIAQRLSEEQKQVVVIDQNPDKLRRIETTWTCRPCSGPAPSHRFSRMRGGRRRYFLAVTDSDETNIVACLFANTIAPKAMKLARIRTEEYTAYPQLLGSGSLQISMLINPEQEIVRSIERLLTLPGAVEYGQLADGFIRMVGMRVESGPLIEQPLTRFREIVQDDGIMVGAIARGQKLIVPSGSDVIKAGDTVYFAYKPTSQRALLRALHKTRGSLGTACIVGGGTSACVWRGSENRAWTPSLSTSASAANSWRTSCRVRWSCTATARTSPSRRKGILIRWTPSSR
ncbi:MAG: NAD-binding protein [Bilophila wadsworthia]